MSETTDYQRWLDECRAHGLDGPHTIVNQPHLEQFVAKGEGTMAIWNSQSQRGYVFVPARAPAN